LLRAARERAGLRHEEVAASTGLSFGVIRKYESGTTTPRVPTLIRLAELYGVTVDELLDHNPEAVAQ
jgi:transcriptional regulator with XRE-family HTH domain